MKAKALYFLCALISTAAGNLETAVVKEKPVTVAPVSDAAMNNIRSCKNDWECIFEARDTLCYFNNITATNAFETVLSNIYPSFRTSIFPHGLKANVKGSFSLLMFLQPKLFNVIESIPSLELQWTLTEKNKELVTLRGRMRLPSAEVLDEINYSIIEEVMKLYPTAYLNPAGEGRRRRLINLWNPLMWTDADAKRAFLRRDTKFISEHIAPVDAEDRDKGWIADRGGYFSYLEEHGKNEWPWYEKGLDVTERIVRHVAIGSLYKLQDVVHSGLKAVNKGYFRNAWHALTGTLGLRGKKKKAKHEEALHGEAGYTLRVLTKLSVEILGMSFDTNQHNMNATAFPIQVLLRLEMMYREVKVVTTVHYDTRLDISSIAAEIGKSKEVIGFIEFINQSKSKQNVHFLQYDPEEKFKPRNTFK